ncbi:MULTISPECIES: flavin reductase family protein [Agrobacterium]|uniref:Flavin reductase family protein n=1 Tax=Agrobacterium rosae TaxID=1972867 RepID=A0AAW9FD80_9HYPH|nr:MULTISPECIES: flavin reductase family protein [Agrobacterium]MDX8302442.1 flavin reductase family protein [Agrobacterium rosae]SCX15851.1 p-hydroxyphenylacetate 3-hydroxylase, reductase component [Agrobacterium sp. DSM 25558]
MPDIIDPRALRDAFGAFPTGVTVVTTRDADGRPIGFTANSFTSVSLDPPMLLVCLARTSRNFGVMTGTKTFAVNILSETQKDVSNTFARPVEDRFAAVSWSDGPDGCPVFDGVAAWFECTMENVLEAGDHVILLGRIAAFTNSGRNGLGYARGGYFTPQLAGKAVSAASEGALEISAVLERDGDVLLLGTEPLSLPTCHSTDGDPTLVLAAYLEKLTGLSITVGFLYSVFEDKSDGRQHIVYRAFASEGAPKEGRFFSSSGLWDRTFNTPATADIVNRFAMESSIGNFGVYVGNETAGRVHSISMKGV